MSQRVACKKNYWCLVILFFEPPQYHQHVSDAILWTLFFSFKSFLACLSSLLYFSFPAC